MGRKRRLSGALRLDDFEPLARRALPRPLFGYVSGGSEDNVTRDENRSALRNLSLTPQVLRDVSRRSQTTKLFGREWAGPFGIAPMGLAALIAFEGDLALARAAHQAQIPMALSGASFTAMERVIAAAPETWFQLYAPADGAWIDRMLARVASANVTTLVLTVDVPVPANRENLMREGFSAPFKLTPRLMLDVGARLPWLFGSLMRTTLTHGWLHFENSNPERGAALFSNQVTADMRARDQLDWTMVTHIRKSWRGNLVIKGILHAEDARKAEAEGADGIIVSNHGGRQLDGAVPAIRALPQIVDAVQSIPVMVDSGFRRGADVLKALSLGATFVFVGRPFLFAAAAFGEAGVRHGIDLLHAEIDRDMAMLGVSDLRDLDPSYLTHF